MKSLNPKSIAVYNVIERHFSLCGQSPSASQIMAETGLKNKNNVAYQLDRLEQAGWITREPYQLHAIIPVKYPRVHYRLHDTSGWVQPPPDYTNHCPDCDRSGCAITQQQPNPRPDNDLDRFTQRQPLTDVHREWKPNRNRNR